MDASDSFIKWPITGTRGVRFTSKQSKDKLLTVPGAICLPTMTFLEKGYLFFYAIANAEILIMYLSKSEDSNKYDCNYFLIVQRQFLKAH